MLIEGFYFASRARRWEPTDETFAYSPYFDDFGHAPGDTELADEQLARTTDPLDDEF